VMGSVPLFEALTIAARPAFVTVICMVMPAAPEEAQKVRSARRRSGAALSSPKGVADLMQLAFS
jgi:hypothetical protein